MSALADVLDDLHVLKDSHYSGNESLKNYESRFATEIAKYNSHGQFVQVHE